MITGHRLLAAYDDDAPPTPLAASGFDELDSLTGGMVRGRVWIVVATPGQGRTTLLTQWAAALARGSDELVHLATPREGPATIAARLLALTGLIPLPHLTAHAVDSSHPERLTRARAEVSALSLCLYALGEDAYIPEVHPFAAVRKPAALVIDDADLVSGLSPAIVAECAAAGMFVLISLPRHHTLITTDVESDLDHTWARVADVVVEVRHRGLSHAATRPGEGELDVHHNRWGSGRMLRVQYQGHYSRFLEALAEGD